VRRPACLAVLASVLVGGAAPGWAADPALDGEVLSQHTAYMGPVDGICAFDAVDGTESYTFEFAGTAGGPYPGTFEASVQVTIEPETAILSLPVFLDGFPSGQSADDFLAAGPLVVVDSQFTIDSPQALVDGATTLFGVALDAEHAGVCQQLAGGGQFNAFGSYKDVAPGTATTRRRFRPRPATSRTSVSPICRDAKGRSAAGPSRARRACARLAARRW
jgi:hypothetical protein